MPELTFSVVTAVLANVVKPLDRMLQ